MKIIRFENSTAVLSQEQFEFYLKVKSIFEKNETFVMYTKDVVKQFGLLPREIHYRLSKLRDNGALSSPRRGFLKLNTEI